MCLPTKPIVALFFPSLFTPARSGTFTLLLLLVSPSGPSNKLHLLRSIAGMAKIETSPSLCQRKEMPEQRERKCEWKREKVFNWIVCCRASTDSRLGFGIEKELGLGSFLGSGNWIYLASATLSMFRLSSVWVAVWSFDVCFSFLARFTCYLSHSSLSPASFPSAPFNLAAASARLNARA